MLSCTVCSVMFVVKSVVLYCMQSYVCSYKSCLVVYAVLCL